MGWVAPEPKLSLLQSGRRGQGPCKQLWEGRLGPSALGTHRDRKTSKIMKAHLSGDYRASSLKGRNVALC